ncbi:MAM and LDL-receptor class A domain-containing protein 1-like [Acanthaster planci]|uniref:MAM and LDL-receptor class A domain-containing protein 1-like n=1 Tax=Acanthaster planci TaxID=133434 RepID=A0A8B7ZEP1_ACAPL|nr:MAM and LDL-receptor class A domain-containing protein 1-like [Acanthaster planci]
MACISLTCGLMLGLSLFVRASLGFDCTFEHGMCGWKQSWDDAGYWMRRSGRSPSYYTGPLSDRTPGSSTNYYCYSNGGSHSSSNAVLLSPIVKATDVRQFIWRFSFWYNMYGSDIGRLNVYKTPVNGRLSEGRVIFSRHGQQTSSSEWLEGEIYITDVASSFRIAFEAIRQYLYDDLGHIAIDDVTISDLPT